MKETGTGEKPPQGAERGSAFSTEFCLENWEDLQYTQS